MSGSGPNRAEDIAADDIAADVTVVGGGVVGLTIALRLAVAGHQVRVVSADPVTATTSSVAAAIWSPYRVAPVDRVPGWAMSSFESFAALAAAGTPGVWMRPGRSIVRHDHVPWWIDTVPGAALVTGAGGHDAISATIPVVDTGVYLGWLLDRVRAAGVAVESSHVDRLGDIDGSCLVLAAGLQSGPFVGDDSGFPVRGQIVRLANPGLTEWMLDEDDPAGLTYVVPRGDDVVCGGTADVGASDTEPDIDTESAILARCHELVPSLRGAPVRSRAVGLRPARPTVRLERMDVDGRPVVTCYGHGGAGVTLSWGCAAEVAALVGLHD